MNRKSYSTNSISFATDIRPLFRPKDINAMRNRFDLSQYEDVRDNADDILSVLQAGNMPCDGPWPESDVNRFAAWVDGGKQP